MKTVRIFEPYLGKYKYICTIKKLESSTFLLFTVFTKTKTYNYSFRHIQGIPMEYLKQDADSYFRSIINE